MRADRLVATLLFLQTRGRVTAATDAVSRRRWQQPLALRGGRLLAAAPCQHPRSPAFDQRCRLALAVARAGATTGAAGGGAGAAGGGSGSGAEVEVWVQAQLRLGASDFGVNTDRVRRLTQFVAGAAEGIAAGGC